MNSYYSSRQRSKSQVDLNHFGNHSDPISSSMLVKSSSAIIQPFIFNQQRKKDRYELSKLNDEFADYIEKVRYLESYNKKIEMDMNLLTEKQIQGSKKFKAMFENEIAQLKETAEKLLKNKHTSITISQNAQNLTLPVKRHLTESLKDRDSSKYDTEKIERQLSSVEGDIQMYNRRLVHQDNEHQKWKQFISQIQRLTLQAKNEIHNEILARASCEKTVSQLRIDISKLNEQQRKRVNDIKKTSYILMSNSTNERALTFRSELSNGIRSIRQEFETRHDSLRSELYEKFKQTYEITIRQNPDFSSLILNELEQKRIKQEEKYIRTELQDVRNNTDLLSLKNSDLRLRIHELQIKIELNEKENKRILQTQEDLMNKLKLKHENMTKEYENVISKQLSLENEIATYGNLLDGMKPVVDQITDDYNLQVANNAKQQYQNSLITRRPLSMSTDVLSSTPHRTDRNETDSYVSFMTINLNNNHSRSLRDISTITERQSLTTNRNFGDFYLKPSDINQQIVEQQGWVNYGSPTNNQHTIIIQTRRKK
ncbi:unnamed protein product [Rotaria magnacalcarata]|uniref:IF rod domain-containing protein n=1 Tax=Rotaria magnacalcarata TaxID=392030 RepID=A0A816LE67_9BILA|nr:unnamed protein product [Rotaria magnacalcarata]CAF1930056.1 unnamed protein product [Rotaria magnacalcarata]CAF4457394.1 unnamed protein product [Rotaria magnacalcarata]CAF4867907.1 unnamed protein product [Rotaria magnacalcarata]